MNDESTQLSTFDYETLRPLNRKEVAEVTSGCNEFNDRFNRVFAEQYRYQWTASPLNLSSLDYDFYKLGGAYWSRDNGLMDLPARGVRF